MSENDRNKSNNNTTNNNNNNNNNFINNNNNDINSPTFSPELTLSKPVC
jgi:hypothetical protein